MSTQCKCILLFGNNMKHFNVLKWHVNLILKHCLAFKCLIVKINYRSHGMTTKKVLLYWNYTLFLRVAKNYDKNLKQNISLYYCTISYYFQKQVWNKWQSCFSAWAGKIVHIKSSRENWKCHPYLSDFLQTFPGCWHHKN